MPEETKAAATETKPTLQPQETPAEVVDTPRRGTLETALEMVMKGEKDRSKIDAEIFKAGGIKVDEPANEEGKSTDEPKLEEATREDDGVAKGSEHPAEQEAEAKPEDPFAILPTDTKGVQKRIKGALAARDAEKAAREKIEAEAAELRKRNEELEAKLKDIPEDAKAQLEEKVRLQRLFELENDPEFKAFDSRISEREKEIQEALSAHPDWPALKSSVEKAGGWAAFARSPLKINTIDEKGKVTGSITPKEAYKRLMDEIPAFDADMIRAAMTEQTKAEREKRRFVEEETAKSKQWKEQKAKALKESSEAGQRYKSAVEKAASALAETAIDQFAEFKDVEVPNTPDETIKKPAIEENKRRAAEREALKKVVSTAEFQAALAVAAQAGEEEIKAVGKLAVDSIRYETIARQNAQLAKQVESLRAEIDNVKSAGRTTRNSGSATTITPSTRSGPPARLDGEGNIAYSLRLMAEGHPNAKIMEWTAATAR